jgi:hypothetical protein
MVTVVLQIMPYIRRHYPAVHRISGRLYVFAGVIPSALLGLFLLQFLPTPVGKVGLAAQAVLWIGVTMIAFRMIRRRQYAEHRRWMIYSFALTLGTSWSRVLFIAMTVWPTFQMDELLFLEVTSWLGWMINLVIAHWWIERTSGRPLVMPAVRPAR